MGRSNRFFVGLFALLSLTMATAVTATTYVVAPSGGDFTTVQAALDRAVAGDVILVRNKTGGYNEKIIFPRSGNAGNYITLMADAGAAPIIDGTGLAAGNMVLIPSRSYIKIIGFEIRNNLNVNDASGIRVTGSGSFIEIRNNRIHEIRGSDAMGITVYGTQATAISDLIIDGNEIYNCDPAQSEALTLNGNVTNFQVTNNIVRDVNNIGIDFIGGETSINPNQTLVARNGVCRGNQVYRANSNYGGGYAGGIYVDGGKDIVIENNIISDCDLGIEIGAENPNVVASGIIVRNNRIYLNQKAGLVFGGYDATVGRTKNCQFLNNVCYKNDVLMEGLGEVWIQYAENNVLRNNIFYSNAQNVLLYSEAGNVNNALDYNQWYTDAGANSAEFVWRSTSYVGFTAYRNGSGQDANSQFGNPLLVNPATADFHVANNSPTLDKGDPAFVPGAAEVDIDNQARVSGGRVDIGADEIQQNSLPSLSINDVAITEGNSGAMTASFTVTLSPSSSQTVTLNYATANGTATVGSDYTTGSGTVTFPANVTTQTIVVMVNGDVLDEPNETFFVNLSNATNATIVDAQGQGTITDDDPTPSLSINDVTVTEGNTGTVTASFTVILSAASGHTVTVSYSTANGTATSGSDYVSASGTATLPTGSTTHPIAVTVNGDLVGEPNEAFFVNLSGATNATIADNQGQGTITNDDLTPSLSINDMTVTEGNSGTMTASFIVTLSATSGQTVTVSYATSNGTATAGSDYVSASGTLTFPANATTQTIVVPVNGDVLDEPNETFFVNLSGATNATITDNQGQGTITDNDPPPSFSINDVTVTEGNSGTVTASFTVTLSAASGQTVTMSYATSNGTATSGSDYVSTSGTATFPAGSTTRTIAVMVNGDLVVEPNETFFVNLSKATNATIVDNQGRGTITNDDSTPSLSINDVTVTEGNSGTVTASFTVTLSPSSSQSVTVNYATSNGTASAGSDYTARSTSTLTFPAGSTTQAIAVTVNGDLVVEPNETFFVNLSNATNATIVDNQGQGTITNDDTDSPNLALGKSATAKSTSGSNTAAKAVDGNSTTYWQSGSVSSTTKMWIYVDLQSVYNVGRVVIKWRGNYYAKKYQIETSLNGSNYTTAYTDNAGNGGTDDITFPTVSARYVEIWITQNNTSSERINEFEIYAGTGALAIAESVEETGRIISDQPFLASNYPNPFNPRTQISYSVPSAVQVSLKVFNLAGQEVATLVNKMHERGNYTVTFDASRLTSGVYFSVLQAGEVRQVRRLVFMK